MRDEEQYKQTIRYQPTPKEMIVLGWRDGERKMIVTDKKEDIAWFNDYCDRTEYKERL